ncbi:hypothetical protein SLEP1_g10074 [Rubroshorea leprosula]|uniref:Uncharacterized protein n=1 Tax=Rubroshorea leprosula TaxID=152421 RepID=A0AAV5I6Y5_9ROSI|nr:hypothetical protein SLEP1_g10074 [Rubroshorea leprosula]
MRWSPKQTRGLDWEYASNPASIASLADFIKSQFGKLDILSTGLRCLLKHESAEEGLKTNYHGAKRMCEALIPLLQLSDSPRIVDVSSSTGKLEYVSNEWAKVVLGDVENLTEDRVDEVLSQYLKDYKEGILSVEEGAEDPVRLTLLPHGGPSGLFFEQLVDVFPVFVACDSSQISKQIPKVH